MSTDDKINEFHMKYHYAISMGRTQEALRIQDEMMVYILEMS